MSSNIDEQIKKAEERVKQLKEKKKIADAKQAVLENKQLKEKVEELTQKVQILQRKQAQTGQKEVVIERVQKVLKSFENSNGIDNPYIKLEQMQEQTKDKDGRVQTHVVSVVKVKEQLVPLFKTILGQKTK